MTHNLSRAAPRTARGGAGREPAPPQRSHEGGNEHLLRELDQPGRVAPLVVVPGDHLHLRPVDDARERRIEDRRERRLHDVRRDDRGLAVAEDVARALTEELVDLLDRRLAVSYTHLR